MPWLCSDCETKFSAYETAFVNRLFRPWLDGNNRIFYEAWLLKFCVSVSWRVVKFAYGRNNDTHYTAEQIALLKEAEAQWRAFLRGDVSHPGSFEQHILFFDVFEDTNVPDLPTNINRWITGAVTLDIVGSDRQLMTFAKLGKFMIFGIIQKGSAVWQGTKINTNQGWFKSGKFVVPAGLVDLFREKALIASDAFASMSETQLVKVDANIQANLTGFLGSDQFEAIAADARLFGMDAVTRKS
jgi:hypothetical protein